MFGRRPTPSPRARPTTVVAGARIRRRERRDTEQAIELFVRREDAETFLAEVRADDEELAALLRLEPVELEGA